MEGLYLTLIGFLVFAIVYLMIRRRLESMIDEKMNSHYKKQMSGDIQEFYREMESYSAIIENRILRFNKLVTRQEAGLREWDEIRNTITKTKKGKEVSRFIEENSRNTSELKAQLQHLKETVDKLTSTGRVENANPLTSKKESETVKTQKRNYPVAAKANADKKIENSNFDSSLASIAEELVNELPDKTPLKGNVREGNIREGNVRENSVKPSLPGNKRPLEPKIAQAESQSEEKESGLVKMFSGIGKMISPTIGESTTETLIAESNQIKDDSKKNTFRSQMDQRIPVKQSRKIINNDFDDIYSPDELPAKPQDSLAEKRFDPDELILLIQDLKESNKRPHALRALMNSGLKVDQISELSNIPYSDLETTINIYNIE